MGRETYQWFVAKVIAKNWGWFIYKLKQIMRLLLTNFPLIV